MGDPERAASAVIEVAFQIHRELGPGLLESVYEDIAFHEIGLLGHVVERQVRVGFTYRGRRYERGLTLDLLVDGCLVVELKSIERLAPVHYKQVLTYLRATGQTLGLLLNFGGARMADGVRRIVNGHDAGSSRRSVRK